MKHALLVFLLSLAGCQCGPGTVVIKPGQDGGPSGGGASGGGSPNGGGGGSGGGSTGDGGLDAGLECQPPDVLIALDRTLTMHRMADGNTPADTDAGHASSKWAMAINGIEELTTAPLDQSVRFGLELWPREAAGCVTLGERIRGTNGTNTACEGPEIPVQPALGTGAAISALLDAETTKICFSTPTGDALVGARAFLETHRTADAGQFVVLVTDGADWDVSCPNPNPLGVVDGLTDAGISTLVVGFSAEMSLQNGVGLAFLNDMACAGRTAKDFANTCGPNAMGQYRALALLHGDQRAGARHHAARLHAHGLLRVHQLTEGARKGSGVFAIVGTIWGVVALVASFFLAGEGDTPGEFFISRQALWNGGTYYLKFTFLMTLFTVFDVVGVPLIIVSGVMGMLRGAQSIRSADQSAGGIGEPPPSWDVSQTGRRVKQLGVVLALGTFWLGYTGLALFSPTTLKPIGFLASLLLLAVPTLPLFIPAVAFDALIPVRYVEGIVESVQVVQRGNNATAHVQLAGQTLHLPPARVAGVTTGVRAGALVSGFFGTVIRFEKR